MTPAGPHANSQRAVSCEFNPPFVWGTPTSSVFPTNREQVTLRHPQRLSLESITSERNLRSRLTGFDSRGGARRKPHEESSMKILPGRIGTIRKELEGKACPSCGWHRYHVILKCGVEIRRETLYVQCSQCFTRRDIQEAGLRVDKLHTTLFLQHGADLRRPAYPFSGRSGRTSRLN